MDIKEYLPSLGDLDSKIRFAGIFGVAAFVLSLAVGLASGNFITGALATSFVMAAVFMILGYGIVFVVSRYVPELLELVVRRDREAPAEASPASPQSGADTAEPGTDAAPESPAEEFKPLTSDSYTKMESIPAGGEGKLGKHIVMNERKVKYEPKLMAEAIRTMIKKDE